MPFLVGVWRRRFAPLIGRAIEDLFAWNPKATEQEARAVLRHVYPKGLGRHHHPYRMWLKECTAQLDSHYRPGLRRVRPIPREDPNQTNLF